MDENKTYTLKYRKTGSTLIEYFDFEAVNLKEAFLTASRLLKALRGEFVGLSC